MGHAWTPQLVFAHSIWMKHFVICPTCFSCLYSRLYSARVYSANLVGLNMMGMYRVDDGALLLMFESQQDAVTEVFQAIETSPSPSCDPGKWGRSSRTFGLLPLQSRAKSPSIWKRLDDHHVCYWREAQNTRATIRRSESVADNRK